MHPPGDRRFDNNMLDRVITWYPDPVLGDKMVELRWSDWKDAGNGVKIPGQVRHRAIIP